VIPADSKVSDVVMVVERAKKRRTEVARFESMFRGIESMPVGDHVMGQLMSDP